MGRDTPRYFVEAKGSFFWQPNTKLRAAGWGPVPLGKDRPAAVAAAIARNTAVDDWRRAGAAPLAAAKPASASSTPGTVNALLDEWVRSKEYPTNARTKRDYDQKVVHLRKWIGPLPVKAVTPRIAKQHYLALKERTPSFAAGLMRVARAGFGKIRFLVDPGHPLYVGVKDNPFAELDLENTAGEGRLWGREERDLFVATAFGNETHYPSIGLAVAINWWLAQREGDILDLPANALDGTSLIIKQNKTARRVDLPVGLIVELKPLVERAQAYQRVIGVSSLTHLLISELTGQAWDEHQFRKYFRRIRRAAGLPEDLQFMHLRHTGVVEMQDSGCTVSEIASISGHSLSSVTTILERYGRRTKRQAENAINKRLAKEKQDGSG